MDVILLHTYALYAYAHLLNFLFSVSNYIQEVSVTEAVENIAVLCTVVQSEPALICRAVLHCDDSMKTLLYLSSGVTQNFKTAQPCNVTIQVISSNDISQVLEQALFYNVSPSLIPTSTSISEFLL